MSGGDPARLAALLALCRDAVDEIVVALDARVDPASAAAAAGLADRVVRVPYAPPPERTLPWLYAQCRGDWILKLDDDEVPGRAFLDGLRDAADEAVTAVWFPRRWLFGGAGTYLDAPPWVPDFQLRLPVSDGRLAICDAPVPMWSSSNAICVCWASFGSSSSHLKKLAGARSGACSAS